MKSMNEMKETGCIDFIFFPCSDIDIVIQGKWPELPLRKLEKILQERGLAKRESILVLDKAAVRHNYLALRVQF